MLQNTNSSPQIGGSGPRESPCNGLPPLIELTVRVVLQEERMSQSLETVTTESLKAQNDGSCSEPELLEEEVHGGLATVVIIVAACVVWLVVSVSQTSIRTRQIHYRKSM